MSKYFTHCAISIQKSSLVWFFNPQEGQPQTTTSPNSCPQKTGCHQFFRHFLILIKIYYILNKTNYIAPCKQVLAAVTEHLKREKDEKKKKNDPTCICSKGRATVVAPLPPFVITMSTFVVDVPFVVPACTTCHCHIVAMLLSPPFVPHHPSLSQWAGLMWHHSLSAPPLPPMSSSSQAGWRCYVMWHQEPVATLQAEAHSSGIGWVAAHRGDVGIVIVIKPEKKIKLVGKMKRY